jgi:hypothetical protein
MKNLVWFSIRRYAILFNGKDYEKVRNRFPMIMPWKKYSVISFEIIVCYINKSINSFVKENTLLQTFITWVLKA